MGRALSCASLSLWKVRPGTVCLVQVPLGIRLVPGVCMRALGDYSPGMDYARGPRQGCSAEWEGDPKSMLAPQGRPAGPLLP